MSYLISLFSAIVVPIIEKYLNEIGIMIRLKALEDNQASIKASFDDYNKAVSDEDRKTALRNLSNSIAR